MSSNSIWKQSFSLDEINAMSKGTIAEVLDIHFEQTGDQFLEASMPVDHRTMQPEGLLHGGASVVLAETLGSVASTLCIEQLEQRTAVGVAINANHLRPATAGRIKGTVRPVKIGSTIHVWNIEIVDQSNRMVCSSRLTTMIVHRNKSQ